MTEQVVAQPKGCRWCGLAQRDHYQRWSRLAGWTPPTQEQIKQRMKARRTLRSQSASLLITTSP
ncbi:hypothetical protein ACQP25_17015 [Microtetraspora malaysiensis]|uniref:hypothetical protein n=1 Tax=Microtetraspora malaysiensis TaxID=161358 RepID=UPI003D8F3A38